MDQERFNLATEAENIESSIDSLREILFIMGDIDERYLEPKALMGLCEYTNSILKRQKSLVQALYKREV